MRSFLRPLVAAAFFCLLSGCDRDAPPPVETGSIDGYVVDHNKKSPIAKAIIAIGLSSSKEPMSDVSPVTDAKGHFTMPDMPVGSYTLQASAEGYGTQTQTTQVTKSKTAHVTIPLYPQKP